MDHLFFSAIITTAFDIFLIIYAFTLPLYPGVWRKKVNKKYNNEQTTLLWHRIQPPGVKNTKNNKHTKTNWFLASHPTSGGEKPSKRRKQHKQYSKFRKHMS